MVKYPTVLLLQKICCCDGYTLMGDRSHRRPEDEGHGSLTTEIVDVGLRDELYKELELLNDKLQLNDLSPTERAAAVVRYKAIRAQLYGSPRDGFEDKFWNLGQLIIWAATRNRGCVSEASDDNGGLLNSPIESEQYGLSAGSVELDLNGVSDHDIKTAIEDVIRHCRDGALVGEQAGRTISRHEWKLWKIVLEDNIPLVRERAGGITNPAPDLRFSRADILKLFPSLNDEGHWMLPQEPPPGGKWAQCSTYNALKRMHPDGKILRRVSPEKLAELANKKR